MSEGARVNSNLPRLLIVDDNEAIHRDFLKVLTATEAAPELDELEEELFGESRVEVERQEYRIENCTQGLQGVEAVERAVRAGDPVALAFVDMRMPPGIDGLETIERIWSMDPDVEIVICSAYSDYSWDEIA